MKSSHWEIILRKILRNLMPQKYIPAQICTIKVLYSNRFCLLFHAIMALKVTVCPFFSSLQRPRFQESCVILSEDTGSVIRINVLRILRLKMPKNDNILGLC